MEAEAAGSAFGPQRSLAAILIERFHFLYTKNRRFLYIKNGFREFSERDGTTRLPVADLFGTIGIEHRFCQLWIVVEPILKIGIHFFIFKNRRFLNIKKWNFQVLG